MIRRLLRAALRAAPGAPPRAAPSAPPRPRGPTATLHLEGDPEPRGLEVDRPIPGSLLLDIREPGELASGVAPDALLLPMDLVPHHLDALPRDRPITVYCAAGARSFGVAAWLREQGFAEAWSLDGGLSALRAAGIGLVRPAGVAPGTPLRLPPHTRIDGAWAGARAGEVIQERDGVLEIRVIDEAGVHVRVTMPTPADPG